MEKKITQLEGCEKQIEITLTKSEIQPFIEKAYAEAAPKVDLKGFRKGKVPRHVVKQFFGKQLEFDAKQDASNDYFQKIVKEENIRIVSQPGLTDMKEDENGATFTVVFESFPEFELGEYRGLNIDEPIHRVTDEEIEHELLHLSINAGEINEAEEVKNDMFIVKYNYRKVDDATNLPLIGETEKDAQLFLHNHDIYPALRDRFINLKVGDSFNYLPAPNDKFPVNEMVMVTITEIKEVVPKELNDEFAKEYSGGKFESIDDLKTEITFQLQEQWDTRTREAMESQILDKLVGMHEFVSPPSLVNSVALEMAEDMVKRYAQYAKGLTLKPEQFFHEMVPQAQQRVKWEIIKSKIIEKEDIKLEDYDIDQFVETEAGKYGIEKEAVRIAFERNEQISDGLLNKKVLDLILDFAITSETEFPTGHQHNHNDFDDGHDDHDHEHEHHHDVDEPDEQPDGFNDYTEVDENK